MPIFLVLELIFEKSKLYRACENANILECLRGKGFILDCPYLCLFESSKSRTRKEPKISFSVSVRSHRTVRWLATELFSALHPPLSSSNVLCLFRPMDTAGLSGGYFHQVLYQHPLCLYRPMATSLPSGGRFFTVRWLRFYRPVALRPRDVLKH